MGNETIHVDCLTTWHVAEDGKSARLGFADRFGGARALNLSIDALSGLMMTIPRILRRALQTRFNDPSYRMIHKLGDWRVETAFGTDAFIVSLATSDGFDVSFSIPPDQARQIGAVLCEAGHSIPRR